MSSFAGEGRSQAGMSLLEKLRHVSWGMLLVISAISGMGLLIAVALVDFRVWLRYAYPLYAVAFLLLVYVEVAGQVGMGAQRWIAIGSFQLQPSEMMKISPVLAPARYFNGLTYEEIGKPQNVVIPVLMVV